MSSEYPSDWESRRRNVYSRDNYTCQNCGANGGTRGSAELHAHHIVPKSKGGSHKKSNLVTLCRECHGAIHGSRDAPTTNLYNSRTSKATVKKNLIEILNELIEVEKKSNTSLDMITNMIDPTNKSEFLPEKYLEERSNVVQDMLMIKLVSSIYHSNIKNRVEKEMAGDLNRIINSAQESIGNKLSIITEVDKMISEFEDRNRECSKCGHPINDKSNFCKECGKEIVREKSCEECGQRLDEDTNFCPKCGTEAPDEVVTDEFEPIDMQEIEVHYNNISNKIDKAGKQLHLTMTLIAKFVAINTNSNYSVLFSYCPNCGLKRGVIKKSATASCVLCEGEWFKKGILSTHWVLRNGSNIGKKEDKVKKREWESIGQKKNEKKVFEQELNAFETQEEPGTE